MTFKFINEKNEMVLLVSPHGCYVFLKFTSIRKEARKNYHLQIYLHVVEKYTLVVTCGR